jgi:hypothetical protein
MKHRIEEITVMSLHSVKSFSRPLLLAAAALLIHTGSVVAADSAGDVQQQMREVLAGKIAIQSAPPSDRRDERAVRSAGDAQELARRLLRGVPDARVRGTEAITRAAQAAARDDSALRERPRVRGDAQAIAQRLLLGQRNATAAGS